MIKNALQKWTGGTGLMGIANRDMRSLITEGADIIMKYRKNPMMPAYRYEPPKADVPVLHGEQDFEVYVAGVVAASVRSTNWTRHEFYMPARYVDRIESWHPWQALQRGLARHDISPLLTHTREVWCFGYGEEDFILCSIKLCLGEH